MRRTAFTLLELILVLAIIISIAAMGIAGFQRQYARSQFKNGVVQLQIDLLSTRLVAMQSGTAYVFRYVPGSSVYEIAPLKTLQEALYRMNGDALDDSSDALGGSLTSVGGGLGAASVGAVGLSSPTGLYGEPEYTDDLFSQENILADLKAASALNATMARQAASLGGSESAYGGSLQSPGGTTSAFDSSSLYESADQPLGGLTGSLASSNPPATSDPLASSAFGASSDFSGSGSEFALGTDLTGGIASETANTITVRDLTPYESWRGARTPTARLFANRRPATSSLRSCAFPSRRRRICAPIGLAESRGRAPRRRRAWRRKGKISVRRWAGPFVRFRADRAIPKGLAAG